MQVVVITVNFIFLGMSGQTGLSQYCYKSDSQDSNSSKVLIKTTRMPL